MAQRKYTGAFSKYGRGKLAFRRTKLTTFKNFNKPKSYYKIKLVKKTINFITGILKKTYKITKVISKGGVVQKVTIGFFTVLVGLGLRFGSLRVVEPIIQSQTQIERQLQHSRSTQLYKAIDGFKSKSPSVSNLLKLSGGDLGKGSSPGARARSDARKAITNRPKAARSKPGGSGYAEAWSSNPSKRSRPAAANHLAQQFKTGPIEGGNGLFGRFSARPTLDRYNPGCAGGPRSITVLNQSKSPEQDSVREIIAHDGVKGKLTDKSTSHLTSKHGDVLGIDDPLPPNPNQKPTKHEKIRTRINKENKEKFGDTVEEILKDPNTEPYPDVSMRGIKGHGYHTENYGESGFFVGIHTEGDFKGQIKKAQPISEQQFKILQEENRID